MNELAMTIDSVIKLKKKMRKDWKWQHDKYGKIGKYYPEKRKKPSEIYYILYNTLPFSATTKSLLLRADKEWEENRRKSRETFCVKVKTNHGDYRLNVFSTPENKINAIAFRLFSLTGESIPLIKSKIKEGIYDIQNLN